MFFRLAHAKVDIMNLTEENKVLRTNIKEYQRSLDACELAQQQDSLSSSSTSSPVTVRVRDTKSNSVMRKSVRKSIKKLKKTDISEPEPSTYLHIAGAKIVENKMTIIDNTGLLDPRVRKFLAIAGKE